MSRCRVVAVTIALLGVMGFPVSCAAQVVNETQSIGDLSARTVGVTLAAVIAFSTTIPGLMLFFAGMVRRKNVLCAMTQCLLMTLIMSLVWVGWGYSLAFAEGKLWGDLRFVGLTGIARDVAGSAQMAQCLLFCAAFALATSLLCGSVVERMRLLSLLLFSVLWGTFVFCPLCHWSLRGDSAMGVGWFQGTIDSCGAQAIHIAAGVSALVSALLVGRRLGYGMDDMRPHNLTYTTLGTAMIWVGALGMHFGMALSRGVTESAVNAVLFTHLSMAGGALSWAAIEWLQRRKPSILGLVSGVVAGFAGSAAGSSEVDCSLGFLVGLCCGVTAFAACGPFKNLFKYDDSLDIFGVHAVAGAMGLLVAALLASDVDTRNGFARLGAAGLGLLVTTAYSITVSLVILKALDWVFGLRVPQESEMRGLDISQHGQEGYIFN